MKDFIKVNIKSFGKVIKLLLHHSIKLITLKNILTEKMKLNPYETLFFFIGGKIFTGVYTVGYLYSIYKGKDEILNIYSNNYKAFG